MPVSGYTPSYESESPYGVTPVVGNFLYYYIHRSITPQDDDIEAVMDNPIYTHRPDMLANDLYGNPDLWWIFGVRNGWEDPVYDMEIGVKFAIPTLRYIGSML